MLSYNNVFLLFFLLISCFSIVKKLFFWYSNIRYNEKKHDDGKLGVNSVYANKWIIWNLYIQSIETEKPNI